MSKKINIKKSNVILKDYVEVERKKYYLDGKKVLHEPSGKEIQVATWISKKLGVTVELLPKIKMPEGIQTADYIIENEFWDLKDISSNRNDAIYNRIRGCEKQAANFILDISKSKTTIKVATNHINKLYGLKNFNWIKKVMLKKKNILELIERK